MAKRTYVLDDATVRLIQTLAERRHMPQSHVVREAVAAFAAREEKLTDEERQRKLQLLDRLTRRPPTRNQRQVDAELNDIRRSRTTGWRRASD